MQRELSNIIKQGEVAEVNPATQKIRVRAGELCSDWVDYLVPAAGDISTHRPPSVGETCLLLSPSGDTSTGVALCGITSSNHPSPGQKQTEHITKYKDGAVLSYDYASGALIASGIKTASIQALEKITLSAPEIVLDASTSVVLQTPTTTATQALVSDGPLTFKSGMSGAGGGGSGVSIDCPVQFTNSVQSQQVIQDGHKHIETGSKTEGPEA